MTLERTGEGAARRRRISPAFHRRAIPAPPAIYLRPGASRQRMTKAPIRGTEWAPFTAIPEAGSGTDLAKPSSDLADQHDRGLLVLVAGRVVGQDLLHPLAVDATGRPDDPRAGEVVGVDDADVAAECRRQVLRQLVRPA